MLLHSFLSQILHTVLTHKWEITRSGTLLKKSVTNRKWVSVESWLKVLKSLIMVQIKCTSCYIWLIHMITSESSGSRHREGFGKACLNSNYYEYEDNKSFETPASVYRYTLHHNLQASNIHKAVSTTASLFTPNKSREKRNRRSPLRLDWIFSYSELLRG
jgi:hypothetical protein